MGRLAHRFARNAIIVSVKTMRVTRPVCFVKCPSFLPCGEIRTVLVVTLRARGPH